MNTSTSRCGGAALLRFFPEKHVPVFWGPVLRKIVKKITRFASSEVGVCKFLLKVVYMYSEFVNLRVNLKPKLIDLNDTSIFSKNWKIH